MPKKCSVPACNSNYSNKGEPQHYVTVYKFPEEPQLREIWKKKIPRANLIVNKNTVVCIKHFDEQDLLYYDSYVDKAGVTRQYPRKVPALKPGAYPRIFPNTPAYLSEQKPRERTDPEDRRKKAEEFKIKKEEAVRRENLIYNFENLKNFPKKLDPESLLGWKYEILEDSIIFYLVNFDEKIPQITSAINIDKDLHLQISFQNLKILKTEYEEILEKKNKIEKWTQLNELLNKFSDKKYCPKPENSIKSLLEQLKNLARESDDKEISDRFQFLLEQIDLLFAKVHRYSPKSVIFAYMIFSQSSSCYDIIRNNKILTLPHPRQLRQLSSDLHIGPSNEKENEHFLKAMTEKLDPKDKHVVLQIDEIYVQPTIDYKAGMLIGMAENMDCAARTIQAYLASSAYGHFREVVALAPVKNLTGEFSYEKTKDVLNLLQKCGLKPMVTVADGNGVNGKMYGIFTNGEPGKISFKWNDDEILATNDSVHALKNIANCWRNQKDPDQTFYFPSFEQINPEQGIVVLEAKYSDLRNIYLREKNLLVKSAPKLNFKTLFPSKIERQKISLATNVFHETTLSAVIRD